MAAIVKPTRTASFAKHRTLPVDLLDAQIQNLIDAIHSTQEALSDVRRDDGQPRHAPVQRNLPDLKAAEGRIAAAGDAIAATAASVQALARDVDLRAKDAEAAAFSALGNSASASQFQVTAFDAVSDAENSADRSEYAATQSENSAQFSKAQTDNAIAAKVEATQWAEYLAGPVVNVGDAPAYVENHPYGHGLYYQPVEGGVAGLWSAKFWALQAYQLVGAWKFFYLGSWASPPVPGSVNPETGLKVPTPLAPGSFYYNTTSHQLFVWDGTQWTEPFVTALAPGFQNSYTYVATAGQTQFFGADAFGHVPDVGIAPSDVHVNGLRLVYGSQYSVDQAASKLILVTPATAGQVVQWDLLFSQDDLGAGGVNIRKIVISPAPDGVRTSFLMTYIDPSAGSFPTDVASGVQLQIVLDGIMQEPGADYVASGDVLTMGAAPPATAHFWGLWFVVGASDTAPIPALPINTVTPVLSGSTTQGQTLTVTAGGWTGYPTPYYAYQWKSGATNVGLNQTTYATVAGDIGNVITVVVTAANSVGSASATSNPIGPVVAAPTAPANTVAPVISGTAAVGGVLTATTGTWLGTAPITYSYQWKRGATNVGTDVNTYTIVSADAGSTITCVVTGTNTFGSANATSNALGPVTSAPSNSIAPVISGSTARGSVLTVTNNGTWAGYPAPTYAYQWKRGATNVGTNVNTYTTVIADEGFSITCTVTGTNASGNANAVSNAIGPITSGFKPTYLIYFV